LIYFRLFLIKNPEGFRRILDEKIRFSENREKNELKTTRYGFIEKNSNTIIIALKHLFDIFLVFIEKE
jgi:hypothetical protein